MEYYDLDTSHVLHVHYVNGNKFHFRAFSLFGVEIDYNTDMSNSIWVDSLDCSESNNEETYDESDFHSSMVKILSESDVSRLKIYLEVSFVVPALNRKRRTYYLINNDGICSSCEIKWKVEG